MFRSSTSAFTSPIAVYKAAGVQAGTISIDATTGEYTFTAYFSSVGDELHRVKDALVFWRSLTVHFIAKSPARTP